MPTYDAIVVVSFGGPYQPDDVIPFLENVTRGRGVPRERLEEVAQHYYHFGGASPINAQTDELVAALRDEMPGMPVYLGNRNWTPFLADTMRQMKAYGVKRALAVATSAWSSYSSCRQYRENIAAALAAVGEGAALPPMIVDKVRVFGTEAGFVEAMADRVREALAQNPGAEILFTAHSIPQSMARTSRYEAQLREASARVAELAGGAQWRLVWQSRSGPPTVPWLEPDILDTLKEMAGKRVVIAPIGFLSDHMEVMYDLDYEAKHLCDELSITMVRAGTVGTHPTFIKMLGGLIRTRMAGEFTGWPDVCPADCCPAPVRPPARPDSSGTATGRPTSV
jgi:protoporphyrin/coproporphyrin ferrochelatase